MIRTLYIVFLSSFLCLFAAASFGQSLAGSNAAPDVVRLKNGPVNLPAGKTSWLDSFYTLHQKQPAEALIQFYTLPDEAQKRSLSAWGMQLREYVGSNAFFVLLQPGRSFSVPYLRNIIRNAQPFRPEWKIDPYLYDRQTDTRTLTALVAFVPGTSLQEIQEKLVSVNALLVSTRMARTGVYTITLPGTGMKQLAAWEAVRYLGVESQNIPLNFDSRDISKANLVALPVSMGGLGLTGEGVVVGIGDNGAGMYNIDTRERVINFNPVSYQAHGQHVNGTVGGAGIVNYRGQGFAPHVSILDHLYDNVWYTAPQMVPGYNMTITNNSYAAIVGNCTYAGSYDIYSAMVDNIGREFGSLQNIFASGNDGGLNCSPYPSGYGNVVGAYQASKNGLVVGNIERTLLTRTTSSKGPVKDGRLKPEICALGTLVFSTIGGDTYNQQTGTSMACPGVSGGAALVSERYRQLNANVNIPGNLLKALLMNGATDAGNPGPDYSYGFGIMNVNHSVGMLNNHQYFTGRISNGETQTLTFSVPANVAQVKIMLYWHDTAASPSAATALVNDLDLEVRDASNTLHRPLVLDPAPANITNNAVEGADHLNNCEQVVWSLPAAGTYTVSVKGGNVVYPNQDYVVVYDFIMQNMEVTFPATGSAYLSSGTMHVNWEAAPGTEAFTLEFSNDNGAAWTTVDNNIPAAQRYYNFNTPNISAPQCRFRLTRNGTGQQIITPPFVIHPEVIVQADGAQCPGNIAINWNAIANATHYEIIRKKGLYMQAVDTIAAAQTNYLFRGLSRDSTYYVSVRPLYNGAPGWRSNALIYQPNTGSCSNVSHGDLSAEMITYPETQRMHTSGSLTNNELVKVRVRNQDNTDANSYKVSWQVNGGAWQSVTPVAIPANTASVLSLPGNDFSLAGTYNLVVAVQNLQLTDPVRTNDTIRFTFRNLNNDPVALNGYYVHDFENVAPATLFLSNKGFTPDEHWDYTTGATLGRLRSFVDTSVTISGNRSVSMDAVQNNSGTVQFLTGTFNLSAYDTMSDIRLDFDYKLHGRPRYQDSNRVWVRGADNQPWVPVYSYDTSANYGEVIHSGSLSLTSALRGVMQNFSSSFQVRFGQNDTSVIAANDYGNGFTVDNIRLYKVQRDLALVNIAAPQSSQCNLGGAEPVTVRIYNAFNQQQNNVSLYYQVDNGTLVQETLPLIPAYDTVVYTFSQLADFSVPGAHLLSVWLNVAGDTFSDNDSILNFTIRNQPLVTTFPYLENFESNDGAWYASGQNSSWQYGIPASVKINKAASGVKAWKTNLAGTYNMNEQSYLYSPCFDLSGMASPMLSFSMALDIENCGSAPCDMAYIEYTTDGQSWMRLGAEGQGTNWYNQTNNVWSQQDYTRWHVSSIPLPLLTQPVRFRFVFKSDPALAFEGVAIDDIHIYDFSYPIYRGPDVGPVIQTINAGNQWVDYVTSGQLLARIFSGNQVAGATGVSVYNHSTLIDTGSQQYYFPKNFTVKPATRPNDSMTVRFYVTDEDVVTLVFASGCTNCTKPEDAYRLGLTKYDDPNPIFENGSLQDNVDGTYEYYPYARVKWVPYGDGYYAEIKTSSFSEFWFNNGGISQDQPLALSAPEGVKGLVNVYPNPVSDGNVTVYWVAAPGTEMGLQVTDVLGKVVYTQQTVSHQWNNLTRIYLPVLSSGVYAFKVRMGERTYNKKVVFSRP